MNYVNLESIENNFVNFKNKKPFPYAVIDNFFESDVALALANDFPEYESDAYNGSYINQIEIKKTCNIWDRFPPTTYKVLQFLNSHQFVNLLETLTEQPNLKVDFGLHGGGWHIHPPGGKLNVHLDYSIHPKIGLQRKFNLLVYLNPNWKLGWGGDLGLWSSKDNQPHELIRSVEPKFNRAVIFDTTQNSWHGLEIPNMFPANENRKSIALYYLIDPIDGVDQRNRALFAPAENQKNDPAIIDLINRRSQIQGNDPTKWTRS